MDENRGQETLHQVSIYFDKDGLKTPANDPEKSTLQSAPENLKAVNRYFKGGAYDFEIFLVLLFPAFLIIIYLLLQRRQANMASELEKISDKDFDFIEMVRLQKGLEEFDRDFLLQLSFESSITPVYQVLIDKGVFEMVEASLLDRLNKQGESTESNKRIKYLRKLKAKLF